MTIETKQIITFDDEEIKAIKITLDIIHNPFFEDISYDECVEQLKAMIDDDINYLSSENFK